MKNAKKLMIMVLFLFSLSQLVLAEQDTVVVRISCTIPAIPGVNAPLIKEAELPSKKQEKKETQDYNFKKSRQGEMVLAETKKDNQLVQTIYSR